MSRSWSRPLVVSVVVGASQPRPSPRCEIGSSVVLTGLKTSSSVSKTNPIFSPHQSRTNAEDVCVSISHLAAHTHTHTHTHAHAHTHTHREPVATAAFGDKSLFCFALSDKKHSSHFLTLPVAQDKEDCVCECVSVCVSVCVCVWDQMPSSMCPLFLFFPPPSILFTSFASSSSRPSSAQYVNTCNTFISRSDRASSQQCILDYMDI